MERGAALSIWAEHQIEDRVVQVLQDVPSVNKTHHFGRPYISAYQLAIEFHRRFPTVAQALGYSVGGAGIAQRNSLAQYLAHELSGRIRREPGFPVEGAFVSNQDVVSIEFRSPDGGTLTSSLTDSGWDLSMFRIRAAQG